MQDNSAQNQLGPCQLGPHKNRPIPTRLKIQNSAQDNSALFLVLYLDNSSHVLEGLKYVCFIIITWNIRPSRLLKNQVASVSSWYITTTVVSPGGVKYYPLPFVHTEHDYSADTYDTSQIAKSHNRPRWYSQHTTCSNEHMRKFAT